MNESKITAVAQRLFNYFVRGLLFVAPVGLTLLLLFSAFDTLDGLFRFNFESQDGKYFIPGLGLVTVITGTMLIGFIFTVLLPQTIQIWIEKGIQNLPLVKIFYSAFKDLISAFVGDKKKFNRPVVFVVNIEANIKKVGLKTRTEVDIVGLSETVAVYCPHSYAFSGELFLVPAALVSELNLTTSEAMKMIVSGGVSIKEE
ncbi:MAG: DUF502 domain-containing protein [Spirosomaceae bacterium]|nr:DUF502 domain-containing protein [Spirosomataceae bacterium]